MALRKSRPILFNEAKDTNIPNNEAELVTPSSERVQLNDERESVLNYVDDLGGFTNDYLLAKTEIDFGDGNGLQVAIKGVDPTSLIPDPLTLTQLNVVTIKGNPDTGAPDFPNGLTSTSIRQTIKTSTLQVSGSDANNLGGNFILGGEDNTSNPSRIVLRQANVNKFIIFPTNDPNGNSGRVGIDSVVDIAGTGAPNFPNGLTNTTKAVFSPNQNETNDEILIDTKAITAGTDVLGGSIGWNRFGGVENRRKAAIVGWQYSSGSANLFGLKFFTTNTTPNDDPMTPVMELSNAANFPNGITSGQLAYFATSATALKQFSGGTTGALGGNITLYGESHASNANGIRIRRGSTTVINMQTSDVPAFPEGLTSSKAVTVNNLLTVNNTGSSSQVRIARSSSTPATSFLVQATNSGEFRFFEELSNTRLFTVLADGKLEIPNTPNFPLGATGIAPFRRSGEITGVSGAGAWDILDADDLPTSEGVVVYLDGASNAGGVFGHTVGWCSSSAADLNDVTNSGITFSLVGGNIRLNYDGTASGSVNSIKWSIIDPLDLA